MSANNTTSFPGSALFFKLDGGRKPLELLDSWWHLKLFWNKVKEKKNGPVSNPGLAGQK